MAEEQRGPSSKARTSSSRSGSWLRTAAEGAGLLPLSLDKNKFETDAKPLEGLHHPAHPSVPWASTCTTLGSELPAIQRACDSLPSIMTSKVEELARSLRAGIDSVTLENEKLQRQKLRSSRACAPVRRPRRRVEKEAQAQVVKLQAECVPAQTQLALEEKVALQKELGQAGQGAGGEEAGGRAPGYSWQSKAQPWRPVSRQRWVGGPRFRLHWRDGSGGQVDGDV